MLRLSFRHFSSQSAKLISQSSHGKVALIELNRPEALNSLNSCLIDELLVNLQSIEANEAFSAAVITGNNKSFAGKMAYFF